MKLIDTFCYFNEAELCDVRLRYYADVVDHFVILESTHTWRGTKNQPNFKDKVFPRLPKNIKDKVYHKIIDHPNEWLNEESWRKKLVQDKMRDSLVYETRKIQKEQNCYIAYNDLDEFWDKRTLPCIKESLDTYRHVCCVQDYRIVYLDWRAKMGGWGGSRFTQLERLPKDRPMSHGTFKYIKHKAGTRLHPIKSGWHFSYFGSHKQREDKIKSIKDTRNWEQKKNMSYTDIAASVASINEWNSVSRKRKLDARQVLPSDLNLDPELKKLFDEYEFFYFNKECVKKSK